MRNSLDGSGRVALASESRAALYCSNSLSKKAEIQSDMYEGEKPLTFDVAAPKVIYKTTFRKAQHSFEAVIKSGEGFLREISHN